MLEVLGRTHILMTRYCLNEEWWLAPSAWVSMELSLLHLPQTLWSRTVKTKTKAHFIADTCCCHVLNHWVQLLTECDFSQLVKVRLLRPIESSLAEGCYTSAFADMESSGRSSVTWGSGGRQACCLNWYNGTLVHPLLNSLFHLVIRQMVLPHTAAMTLPKAAEPTNHD